MIGHEEVIKDLKTLSAGGRLSHSYIFYGPTMVGKKTTALALAKFLEKGVFERPVEGEVLQDAKLIDLAFAKELDPNVKDSIGIDAVREIKNFLWQKPNTSPKRTLIIDDAELLTTEAENALLKLTEEPPASSLLIVIVSDIESILPTITSRMQKLYFGAVPEAKIAAWLKTAAAKQKTADVADYAKQALGKPGLAWRLAHDPEFAKSLEAAKKFLKTPATSRRDLIKKLIEPDDFNLRIFLDAVIITLAVEKPSKTKAALWHRALALQGDVMNFSLNPRLQLEALLV
jgi:DNA polymerase III subunit delta'